MKFTELSISEYEEFATQAAGRYYLNSSKMIELKKQDHWDTYYVGVKDDDGRVLAAAGFSAVPVYRKFHYGYAQRGILCDFNNHELTSFFTEELKKYLSQHGMAYLRMDPYVEYQQLDQDGNVVPDGFNHRAMVDFLVSLGYQHQGFTRGELKGDSQVRYMVVLDLDNKTEEQLVDDFDPHTRRNIKRAEKLGVQIKELDPDHLEEFMKLMEFTSEKRHFQDLGESAYQRQIKAFSKENAKVIVSYLDMDNFHANIDKERAQVNAELEKIEELLKETPGGTKATNRKKAQLELLDQIQAREDETNALEAEYGKIIILSGAYFVIYDGEMYYIASGSYDQFRKYNGPYFIQYNAIMEAKRRGCHRYNFTGTSGIFDESANDYGVFEFKRRLGGRPIELLGEFKLVCDPVMMKKIDRITKMKHLFHK